MDINYNGKAAMMFSSAGAIPVATHSQAHVTNSGTSSSAASGSTNVATSCSMMGGMYTVQNCFGLSGWLNNNSWDGVVTPYNQNWAAQS